MPQPVSPITLPLIVPAWLPARDRDNTPLLAFMKRTQKATINEKTAESLWSPWQHSCIFFSSIIFWYGCWIEKGKGIVDGCPFPFLNARGHIFISCLWFSESDHLGGRFCLCRQSLVLCRTGWGHQDHKEQASDENGDNKSPSHPYPICSNTWKNNGGWTQSLPPTASSGIFNSTSLGLISEYHRWVSPAVWASVSVSFSCIKQKGIKQLYTKVSTQLGILSSHKVLLQRMIVTFTGSENQARGIQCLFKWQTLYGAFTKDLVE